MAQRTHARVLVIDSAAAPRDRLCALLNDQEGIDVLALTAADATASAYAAFAPSAVVVDVATHGADGFERLAQLRRTVPSCRIIVLTNQTEEAFRRRCEAAGVDHFLSKAREFERVLELVGASTEGA